MATTSLSSATTSTKTAADIAAANKASAQQIISSLSAGSGVDVASLAQSLVDAEKVPRQNAINGKITKNEARISGYSAVSFVMSELNTAFTALKDQNNFNSLAVSNSQSSAFTVTPTATASAASHEVEVLQLAKPQRRISDGFATANSSLNAGKAMTLNFTVGGVAAAPIALADGRDTPQAIAAAINAAAIGVTASLVNLGDGSATPFQLVLTGPTGSAGAFTLNTTYTDSQGNVNNVPNAPGNGLVFTGLRAADQQATDARVKVDGITYTRGSNTLSDVIPNVSLSLKNTTVGSASVAMTRDSAAIKEKFNAMVTAYNDAMSMLNVVSDPKSTVETYGATLVGDSTIRAVRLQLRGMIQGASTTPGTQLNSFWQMGISVDAKGVMSLDETKLDTALGQHFDDVVKSMTGNTNGLSAYSTQPAGFAGEAVRKLTKMVSATGPLLSNSTNAEQQNAKYQTQLAQLDTRMTALLSRYTKQFSAMESLVGSVNSQKTSLKSTFDGMMAAYTNKN